MAGMLSEQHIEEVRETFSRIDSLDRQLGALEADARREEWGDRVTAVRRARVDLSQLRRRIEEAYR